MKIVNSGLSLDELIYQITSSVDSSWSDLKKIRYVYLELGIYLEKNEMFFMSVQNKLSDTYKLSTDVIDKIYKDNLEDGTRTDWDKVVCRSVAIILSKCLSKIGIENQIINSANVTYYGEEPNKVEIRHAFLNARISSNESIFLTLAADLPNIQNNLETQSFGNVINYKKIDEDGNEVIVYEGEEISDAIRVDKEELKKIDLELGYLIPYMDYDYKNNKDEVQYLYGDAFLDKFRTKMVKNKLYYELLIEDTDLFQIYDEKYSDLILDESSITRLREFMIDICDYVDESIGFNYSLIKDFNFEKWKEELVSFINDSYDDEETKNNLLNFTSLTYSTLGSIADLVACILSDSNNKDNLTNYKNSFYRKFNHLCLQFVPKNLIPNYDDEFISQDYIAAKLEKMFKFVFECNVRRTEFNRYGYNEQIALIRTFLPLVFSDVDNKHCMYNRSDNSMSPIFNIIRTFTLKMKKDGTYRIIFEINNSGTKIYYSYNLTSNKIKPLNPSRFLFLAVNNIVCSQDLNDKLKIEEVESYDISPIAAAYLDRLCDLTGDNYQNNDISSINKK